VPAIEASKLLIPTYVRCLQEEQQQLALWCYGSFFQQLQTIVLTTIRVSSPLSKKRKGEQSTLDLDKKQFLYGIDQRKEGH
jgi:hypothetical protein